MHHPLRRAFPAASAAAVAALVLAGCAGTGSGTASDDEFVIGFALSQSGNMAPFDVEPGNAALLRVEQINEAGGINGKPVRTIVKDVQSSGETMGIVTSELLAENIDVLVTPCDFDLSAPGAIAAQAAGVPAVSICAGDPKMADTTTIGDFTFTANAGSDQEGASGASFAIGKGWRNAFLLQDESIEYTKSAGAYFAAAFEELGGTVTQRSSFPGGDSVDIGAQISAIAQNTSSIDFVYVASWNPGGATAIKQIRDAGIQVPIIGPAALDGKLLLDIIGNAGNVYYTAFACYAYCEGADSPALDAFESDYTTRFGAAPSSSYAILGYSMVQALEQAVAAGPLSDGSGLRDAMRAGVLVETPMGQTTYFSQSCHKIIDFPFSVVEAKDGTISFVQQQKAEVLPDLGDGNSCTAA